MLFRFFDQSFGPAHFGLLHPSRDALARLGADAFFAQAVNGSVSVQDIMDYLGITDKTVYARLKKMNGEFVLKKGRIYQADDTAVTGVTAAP